MRQGSAGELVRASSARATVQAALQRGRHGGSLTRRPIAFAPLVFVLAGCGGISGGTVKKNVQEFLNSPPSAHATVEKCSKTRDVFAGDPVWRCQILFGQGSEKQGFYAVPKHPVAGYDVLPLCRDLSGNWMSVIASPAWCAADVVVAIVSPPVAQWIEQRIS